MNNLFDDNRPIEGFLKLAKKIKNKTLTPILSNICVTEDNLIFSNLKETLVTTSNGAVENGLYNLQYNLPFNNLKIKETFYDIEQYPDILFLAKGVEQLSFSISKEQQKELLNSFKFCEEGRFFNGTYIADKKIRTTDGRRLFQSLWEDLPEETEIFLLNTPLIKEILGKASEIVFYQRENNFSISFYYETKPYKYDYARQKEFFPDTDKILPESFLYSFPIFDIKQWKICLKQIKELNVKKQDLYYCLFKFIDSEKAEIKIPKNCSVTGDEISLGYIKWENNLPENTLLKINASYLNDIIETDPVKIEFNESNKAIGFKYNNPNSLALFMPCAIEEEDL